MDYKKNHKLKLPNYFRPLFWSYNFSLISPQKNKQRIIINTINYGRWKHWKWIIEKYGKEGVKTFVENTPETEFRPRALKLITLLLGIKKLKYASRSDYIRTKKNFR